MKLKIELMINSKMQNDQVITMQIDTEKQEVSYMTNEQEVNHLTTTNELSPKGNQPLSFQNFMRQVIYEKIKNGHTRTAEAYRSALHSFDRYVDKTPTPFSSMDENMMEEYEAYLKTQAICMNTVSFYMRILKAVYNKAVRQKIVADKSPFRQVYTGVAKTRKRALSIDILRQIKDMAPTDEKEQFAIDMFMFSFYTRGMSFIDMAYLKKSDIKNGNLMYIRKKTGQNIVIKWESPMQDIVDRNPSYNDTFLLPIIRKPSKSERSQYRYSQYLVNKSLHDLGIKLGLHCDLTMYVARHSWASTAKSIDIPLSIISEAMGHTSEKMTTIYLNSIDEARIDTENRKIIDLLTK